MLFKSHICDSGRGKEAKLRFNHWMTLSPFLHTSQGAESLSFMRFESIWTGFMKEKTERLFELNPLLLSSDKEMKKITIWTRKVSKILVHFLLIFHERCSMLKTRRIKDVRVWVPRKEKGVLIAHNSELCLLFYFLFSSKTVRNFQRILDWIELDGVLIEFYWSIDR